jgi:uncharacterized protein DUF2796
MNMRTTLAVSLAALAVAVSVPAALAEEAHREVGAHVHGHGTLNIAIENDTVAMELGAPGMDLVGFEHVARTDAQKAAVAEAKSKLGEPLALFKLPASAGCSLASAEVEMETEHGDHDDHHDEKEHAHHDDDHHGDKAEAHDDHDEHDEARHSAFHVDYKLTCSDPASLTAITFDYFKTFAGAKELTVNVVTDKAQSSFEVSRDKPQLDLAGMM